MTWARWDKFIHYFYYVLAFGCPLLLVIAMIGG